MGIIISIINQKGGSGKSTTAIHLAYWLTAKENLKVFVVDADGQGSSSVWLESLPKKIPHQAIGDSNNLIDTVPDLATEYDYLIIDGPANLAEATRAVLLISDLALLPCQPAGLDLHSTIESARLIQQAQKIRQGKPTAAAFLNKAVKGTRLKDETAAALSNVPSIKLLQTTVHQKQSITDTFGQGLTVWDLSDRSAKESGREYQKLFTEILGLINE